MRRLDWYIARRYLASRRRGRFLSLITLIAVLGVLLGVMALITVIAVMTGLQSDLQSKILGTNPHVYVFQQGRGFRMGKWQPVLQKVKKVDGVVAAEPFIMTQVGAAVGQYAQPGTLYGIDPNAAPKPMTSIEADLRSGKLALAPTHSGLPGVLVGRRLADKLGLLPGDTLTLISLETIRKDPFGNLSPVMRQFEVTGLFSTGMYEYDSQNLYARIPAVQDLLGIGPDTISGVAVNVKDPWKARVVREAIDRELRFPYWTEDWMRLNQSLFSALKLEKLAMGVILFLIVLVAAFNIITQLIMVVTDKTREIGILKSMGMTDGTVLRVFMLQGLAIGIIGTLLGALGGFGLVWVLGKYHFITLPGDVYFIDTLPVALDPWDFVLIVVASIVVAFAATIYPARQASRLEPVEAIRHE